MPRRIAESTLNASTIDILNVIRQNAGYEYQNTVPVVETAADIPKVGEILYGHPAMANQFINALVNRIAIVRMQSATFNNPYRILKKGYLEYGETIEDIFVGIAQAVEYSAEKAPAREFKRSLPDVRAAFFVMNFRVMYPVTIQDEDSRQAFLSLNGVKDLIARLVESLYTAAEYDEFLLFKYMIIKAVAQGKMYPVSIGDGTDLKDGAVQFRGISNLLPFMSNAYNEAGVRNTTPKGRQIIFMDSMFNARFDVEVLASAFNMDKADFMGRLFLIDSFTTFDNERFEVIRENSDGIEEVTEAELALMQNVKALLIDEDWFQVYDNNNKFTEKYVASGLYWNYFYHTWKTVAHSPFANAVVFTAEPADITLPASVTAVIEDKGQSEESVVLSLVVDDEAATLQPGNVIFIQTPELTAAGIAVQKYGELLIPASAFATQVTLKASVNGTVYTAATQISSSSEVGTSVVLNKG